MAETERGIQWWVRYVAVPIVSSGGLAALVVTLLIKDREATPRPEPTPAPVAINGVAPPSEADLPAANAALTGGTTSEPIVVAPPSEADGVCTRLSCIETALVRAVEVDDEAYIRVNGETVAHFSYSQPSDWVDVKRHLRSGDNALNYTVANSQYGGCKANFQFKINDRIVSSAGYDSYVPMEKAPVNAVCETVTKNLELK
jgi:hypothetical protein